MLIHTFFCNKNPTLPRCFASGGFPGTLLFHNKKRAIFTDNSLVCKHTQGRLTRNARCPCSQLKASNLTAHRVFYLWLLPSRPDQIRKALLRKDPLVNTTYKSRLHPLKISLGNSALLQQITGYKVLLSPRLAHGGERGI